MVTVRNQRTTSRGAAGAGGEEGAPDPVTGSRCSAALDLSKLRFAGLVEGTRDGRRIVYRLRGAHVRNLLTEALFHVDHQVSGQPVHD